LAYVSNNQTEGNYLVDTKEWFIESLEAFSKAELILNTKANTKGAFINEVKVISVDQLDTDISNNKAFADVQVNEMVEPPKEVDLILTKTVNQEVVFEKDTVEFVIVLSNIGPDEATNIQVEENFPDGLEYINFTTSAGEFNRFSGTWNIESMPVSASAQLIIEAKATIPGDYSNYVSLSKVDQIDVGPTNNSAQANIGIRALPKANLSIQKKVESVSVESGETTSFTITLLNNGPDEAFNIAVDELWPSQLIYLSHNASNGNYDADTKEWTLDFLDVNQTANLTIQTQGVTPGNYRNAVSIRSSSPSDENEIDNIAAVNLVVYAPEPIMACENPFACEDIRHCAQTSSTVTICPDFCVPGNFEINEANGAVNGTIELSKNCLEYTPYSGVNNTEDQFLIKATNEQNVCIQIFTIVEIKDCVSNNSKPVILNDEENFCAAPVQAIQICVDAEDMDNDNLSICEIKTHFDCTIGDINDLCFFYTPLPGIVGTRNVSVKVCDGGLPELSTIANYTIDVFCLDPTANPDVLTINNQQAVLNNTPATYFNGTIVFDPTLNDENVSACFPDFFIHAVTKGATYGTEMLVNGSIQYKPDESFAGTDEIEYEICNTCGSCATATVQIDANMCSTTYESCAQPQIENEICVEFCNDNAFIQEISSEANSTINSITQSCFYYTPISNSQSVDTVKIIAGNETGSQEITFAHILIDATCLNPLAENDIVETRENQLKTISILSNDAPNTQSFTINILEDAQFGKVHKNLNGTVTYMPDYGFIGADEFEYWLCNAYDLCSQAKVQVVVKDDFMPNIKAVADNLITNINQPIRINVLANDTIADGIEVAVTNSGVPQYGTNILFNNIISYNPPTNFVGKDQFNYTICNEFNDCDQARVTITMHQNKEEVISHTSTFIPSVSFNIQSVFAANNLIYVNINSSKPKALQYEVVNMLGKTLISNKLKVQTGIHKIKLPYASIASQIVLLRLYDKEHLISEKLFIE